MMGFKKKSPDAQYRRTMVSFVQDVLKAPDTPSLIRAIAMDAEYMRMCKLLVGPGKKLDRNHAARIERICLELGVSYPQIEQKLIPAARSLGIGSVPGGRNFYQILGVKPDASQSEIKSAYRRKALELHPDVNSKEKAGVEDFLNLQTAYRVLSDSVSRNNYDLENLSKNWNESFDQLPDVGKKAMKAGKKKYMPQMAFVFLILILCIVVFVADIMHKKKSLKSERYIPKNSAGSYEMKNSAENIRRTEEPDHRKLASVGMPSIYNETANADASIATGKNTGPSIATSKDGMGKNDLPAIDTPRIETAIRHGENDDKEGGFSRKAFLERWDAENERTRAVANNRSSDNSAQSNEYRPPAKSPAPYENNRAKISSRPTPGTVEKQNESVVKKSAVKFRVAEEAHAEAKGVFDNKRGRDLAASHSIPRKDRESFPLEGEKNIDAKLVSSSFENENGRNDDFARTDNGNVPGTANEGLDGNEKTKNQASEHYYRRLNSFFGRFTQAYAAKNLPVFQSFFASDATENGKSFKSMLSVYRQTFESIDSIKYLIEVKNLDFFFEAKKINVSGEFILIFKTANTSKASLRRGEIFFELEDNNDEFLIKRLVYRVLDSS